MANDGLTEVRKSSKEIFKGKVVDMFLDEVSLPNGEEATREVVRHCGAVAVIAVDAEGRLLLVRQYRYPLGRIIYEVPAGKLEPGEAPDAAAARELEEETGCRCRKLEQIASFYTTPGFSDEIIHLYYTDSILAGSQHLDADEFLEVHAVPMEKALVMMGDGRIADVKSMYAVQCLQLRRLNAELEKR
ncbi:MAG: NUDIX hydrolase [Sporolactobacillus sp.]